MHIRTMSFLYNFCPQASPIPGSTIEGKSHSQGSLSADMCLVPRGDLRGDIVPSALCLASCPLTRHPIRYG